MGYASHPRSQLLAARALLLLGLMLGLVSHSLVAAPVLRYDASKESDLLGPYLEVYRGGSVEAAGITLTADKDWHGSTKDVPSFGMDDRGTASYWVRFRIENPLPKSITIYLANHYPPTDHLRLYSQDADRQLQLIEVQGDQSPYNNRSVRHRFPVFKLSIDPGVHTYYLEQKSLASIQFPLKIWQPDAFATFATHEILMLGGIMGVGAFALMYNFFIFVRLKAQVYFLYVLHNFSICLFLANFLGFTQSVVLPDVAQSWWLNEGAKINMDILHITALLFTVAFLDMKKNAPRWRLWLLVLVGCAVLTLFNTLSWKFVFNKQTAVLSLVASISLLLSGILLWKKLSYARYYTLGWSCLLVLNIITMCSLFGIVPTNIDLISWSQSVGHCLELCLLSLALGERMAWINRQREDTLLELNQTKSELVSAEQAQVRMQSHLLDEREQHIRDLDRKVEERTRELRSILNNLQQGIFAIRLDAGHLLMDPDYSPFLHSLLGTFASQSVDPLNLLFGDSMVGKDDQNRIRSILVSMIDSDRLSFEMNMSSLPREIERGVDASSRKILEIDWDPIVNSDGRIQKMLVAVRDVTEYRALRRQVMSLSEDIIIARDLLREGSSAPVSRIARIANELESLMQSPVTDTAALLRRLHSLKGDSRTLQLKALSEAIHEVETVWIEDRQASDRSREAFAQVIKLAQRYVEICRAFEQRFGGRVPEAEPLAETRAISLQELLAVELAQLPSLARELGKMPPRLHLDGRQIILTPDAAHGLRECFGHLLRNAMDHGIEDSPGRLQAGKPEQGLIALEIVERSDAHEIIMRDDGRGIHLTRLREKAIQKGLDAYGDSDRDAAALVMASELSSRDELTQISGRGIGMDAVRERISSIGGSIDISLLPGATLPGHRLFQIHIRVPHIQKKNAA